MIRPRFAFVIALISCLSLAHAAWAGISFTGGELTNVPKAEFMAAGDLDNDGRADAVVVSDRELSTFLAEDTPSHVAPATVVGFGQELRNLAVGDLNADGRLDVVVADHLSDSIWVLLGQGNGNYLAPRQIEVPNSIFPVALALGNFDDLGNLDIVVIDSRLGKAFIMLNDNANPPLFRRGGEITVGEQPSEVRTVDLNRDGKLDVITLNTGGPPIKELAVALFRRVAQGFPEFDTVQRYTIGEDPSDLITGDFNNDGWQDVAMLNKPRGGDNNNDVNVLINRQDGTLNPPIALHVPCPFFTGGAPCRSLAMALADFDGNGNLDLIITLADPRRNRGSASAQNDAMQVFSGRGDGSFVPGGVIATQKRPIAVAVGDVTGDGEIDVIVANQRTLDMQVFVNTSSPGELEPGEPCLLGEDCLSDRCTNGVCCSSQCLPELFEQCNVPGQEGICVPVAPAIECEESSECEDEDPTRPFCIEGFCCNTECVGGRCATEGFIGICIPGIPDGEECFGPDEECASGHCCDNFICGREACEGGRCQPVTGICRGLLPLGETCELHEECQSSVCDVFDGICCNRTCDSATEICFPGEGLCRSITYTPSPATPTVTATPTFREDVPNGDDCNAAVECSSGICENNVCCETECGDDEHCEEGTGVCVPGGPPGTPTHTQVPTPIATATPADQCTDEEAAGCPGQRCVIINGAPACVSASSSGGCSTGGEDPASGNLVAIALLPFAMWIARRWQLQRVRVRRRR
jgi:hypothetical protein